MDDSDTAHQVNIEPSLETTAEVSHESPLYAETLFHIGPLPITNSLINSLLVVFLVIVFSLAVRSRLKEIPGRLQNFFEAIIEVFLNLFDSVTHSRKKSLLFAPMLLAFFFFILINNWSGILPGVGSVGRIVLEHGEKIFVPFFRGGTADLNTTLALAIIGVFASHVFGVLALGLWHHFNKFVNLKAFLEIPKKIKQDPTVIIVNPIKAFVGIVEIIGEVAKVASLSFRLFGNIFAGEVLLVSMSALLAWVVPIPFLFLEIIVGLIQAFIFMTLILTYLTIHTTAEEH